MRHIFTVLFVFIINLAWGVDLYLIAPQGSWTDNTITWSTSRGGSPCECIPGPDDNVYLEGNQVFIFGSDVEINNMNLLYNVSDQIVLFGETRTLTVNGTIRSYELTTAPFPPFPETAVAREPEAVLITQDLNFTINFAGNGSILTSWNELAPLPNVNISSAGTVNLNSNMAITSGGSLSIASGTLNVVSGANISQAGNAIITVNSGSFLNLEGSINGDGTETTRFNTVNINGSVSIGQSGYINADNFILNAEANLDVGFYGDDQTQGWWYQSVSPTGTFSLDPESQVNYNASADQTVAATTYGNVAFYSPVSFSNKVLQNGNTLDIQGNLLINSANVAFVTSSNSNPIRLDGNLNNNGQWSPTQLVRFAGSSDQLIDGDNPTMFVGGVRIENTAGIVSLFNQDMDVDGIFEIDPSANFDPDVNIVNLSGNMLIEGTLTAGTVNSSFVFDGSSAINGPGEINFNDVIIDNSLTSSSDSINVAGNFTNNGIFNRNNGTVVFNGSDQEISGNIDFHNMVSSASGTVTNSGSINLHGTFDPQTGVFNTGGNFTVMSTSLTNDGRIAAVPATGFTFNGNLTAQRFVDGVIGGDWRYFSSPVVGATLNDWLISGMPITGSFSDSSPAGSNNVTSSSAPSVYVRNSAAGTWDPVTGSSTGSVTLENGEGYSAYTYVNGDLTLETTGTLRSGNVNIPLTGAAGALDPYFLIGNPYPSPIDWDQVHDANPGLGSTVYIRIANNEYASYNIATGIGADHPNGNWDGEILMGQSFWVDNTNAISNVAINESMKSPVGNGQFLRTSAPAPQLLRFELTNEEGTQNDETVIFLSDEEAVGYDNRFDGEKKFNGTFNSETGQRSRMNLSTFNNSDPSIYYVFNGIPNNICEQSIGVAIQDVPEGIYELEFNRITVGAYEVKLIDNFADDQIIIGEGFKYSFEVTSDANSKGLNRFQIQIKSLPIDNELSLGSEITSTCDDSYVAININNAQNGITYQLINEDNDYVSNPQMAKDDEVVLFVENENFIAGENRLSIIASAEGECFNDIIYTDAIIVEHVGPANIPQVEDATTCKGSEITLVAMGASEEGYYRWYDDPDASEPIAGQTNGEMIINDLVETKWYYVSTVNARGCESARTKLKAEVVEVDIPEITIQGQTMVSEEAETYQWYKDGEMIEGAINRELDIRSSGAYQVEITKEGCSAISDRRTFVITSVEDDLFDLGLNIYPNPVIDKLYFSRTKDNLDLSHLNMLVYDAKGQRVFFQEQFTNGRRYLDVKGLKKGLYILNIETGEKTISLQVLKK